MSYACVCSARHLLDNGCSCGAFKREQLDREIIANREYEEAKARQVADGIWLSGQMPKAIIIAPDECKECQHSSGMHIGRNWLTGFNSACREPHCHCVEWQRKP